MEQIKIIREALENIERIGDGYCKDLVNTTLTALAQLEIGMQSVSERSIDIPIEQPTVNEDLIKEIELQIQACEAEKSRDAADIYTCRVALFTQQLLPLLTKCKAALSQVKFSIEEIRNKAINEVADSYHGEMANYFCKKANNEKLAGVKEDYFALADKHREYQNDIKNQVWVSFFGITTIGVEK